MKNNTSKIFLSIVATLNFIVFSPFALSAEDEPNNKIVDESDPGISIQHTNDGRYTFNSTRPETWLQRRQSQIGDSLKTNTTSNRR